MSKKDKGLTALENISYENGDDLSEHIARLVAPPNNCKMSGAGPDHPAPTSKAKNVRPNNDFCSFCSEGGRLICCERCPAAYHYHCCEPPLDPNNLPSEEWLCNSCTTPHASSAPDESNKFLKFAKLDVGLIPTPFDLPDELYPLSDLPGSTEVQSRKRKNFNPVFTEQYKRKFNPAYPDDPHAFTPTPVCYKCDKSDMRNKPLIFCSYCPLAFHLDCMYPPLPFRPNGLWMCPLHPQYSTPNFHALRLSTRLQAHEKCMEPVNEHSVRTKFLKKAKKYQNTIRKSDVGLQRLTTVPGAIEQYYKIGLAFCRNNVTFKTPKSLKELSAASLSENMAKKEGSASSVSSFCSKQNCQHAKKQCKHFNAATHKNDVVIKQDKGERDKGGKHKNNEIVLKGGDNGTRSHNIDEMIETMNDKALRQLAKQFLQQQKGVLANGDITIKHVSPPTPPPPAPTFLAPPTPHKVSDNCLSLSHIVAHSFLQQGDTKYSIRKNSFVIGIGYRADMKLDPSVCKAVSLRHSCILFDKVTGIHELLNYSEYGTIVNNLYYGCSSVPHSISRCVCSPKTPVHGWEGPCQLPDGAVIKMGCHSFTFHRNPCFVWTPEIIIPPEASSSSADSKRESLDFL